MHTSHAVALQRSADDVFAYLSDVRNEVAWRSSIVGSRYLGADGPGVGVDGETDVELNGRALTMRWTVTEFSPPDRFVKWELDGEPWHGGGSYRVTPVPDGCRVQARLDVRVKGAARLLEPVLWFAFRRGLRDDLARLAGVLPR